MGPMGEFRFLLRATLMLAVSIAACRGGQCLTPLGVEDGRIADSQMSASHCWGDCAVVIPRARLNYVSGTFDKGWCSSNWPSNDPDDRWFQIDMVYPAVVSGVRVQAPNPTTYESVKTFTVDYSSSDGGDMQPILDPTSDPPVPQEFAGLPYYAVGTYVTVTWKPTLMWTYRMWIKEYNNYNACMRLELLGCSDNEIRADVTGKVRSPGGGLRQLVTDFSADGDSIKTVKKETMARCVLACLETPGCVAVNHHALLCTMKAMTQLNGTLTAAPGTTYCQLW